MSKFEAICDLMKSENGPVIAGVGGIVLLVGGHYVVNNKYKAEMKKGESSITLAPSTTAPEQANNGQEQPE